MSDLGQKIIPLCEPHLVGRELEYLSECVRTGWVSYAGPFVTRFEQAVAQQAGCDAGAAVASGTAALHLALRLLGVGEGDEVVVPALTFIAPANAVRYVGAWPVFLDVHPLTAQLDPGNVDRFLRSCQRHEGRLVNPATGRRVAGVILVHILGHAADAVAIQELCSRFGIPMIEDATEGLGARVGDAPVGSFGSLACFSFNGNKLLTAGGGGVLTGRGASVALIDRARYLSTQAKDDPIEFVHHEVGYNYRLTNLQAAVGLAQLERIEEHLTAKRRISDRYAKAFASAGGVTQIAPSEETTSAHWLTTIVVGEELGSRDLLRHLAERGIESRPLWQPLHRSPAHRGAWTPGCPVADDFASRSLSLPSSVGLSAAEQDRVIDAVLEFVDSRSCHSVPA